MHSILIGRPSPSFLFLTTIFQIQFFTFPGRGWGGWGGWGLPDFHNFFRKPNVFFHENYINLWKPGLSLVCVDIKLCAKSGEFEFQDSESTFMRQTFE